MWRIARAVYDKFRNINCLKLVATKLAAKTFLKGVSGVLVLLQLNNATEVAYVNNMWGTVSDRSGKGTMDISNQQGYRLDSPTYPGSVRHHSIYGITDSPWQVGLDALPSSHLSIHGGIRTNVCGPVCIQIDTSNIPLFQLETRPHGVSSEYIPTGLRPTERLCQPTVMLNWQSYHAISKPNWCW